MMSLIFADILYDVQTHRSKEANTISDPDGGDGVPIHLSRPIRQSAGAGKHYERSFGRR